MRFSIIPLLLLVIPLAEIAVFVIVGQQIGLLATIALVIATAVAGTILLRVQGFSVLARVQREVAQGHMPARELVHGFMIMVAGMLLLTPGFVTDTLGLLLFIPPVRDAAWRFIRSRIVIIGTGGRGGESRGPSGGRTIELDRDDYKRSGTDNSPWRSPKRRNDP